MRIGTKQAGTFVSRNQTIVPAYAPPVADGSAHFQATYVSQIAPPWQGQEKSPGSGPVIALDTLGGKNVLKTELASGEGRAEVSGAGATDAQRRYGEGEEEYVGQSFLWPAAFPNTQVTWHFNMQLHSAERAAGGGATVQAPIRLSSKDNVLQIEDYPIPGSGLSQRYHSEALRRDVWCHIVQRFGVGEMGEWQAWMRWDDEEAYTEIIPTDDWNPLLSPSDYCYLKQGCYRSASNTDTATVYHYLTLVGDTFTSVQR